ncbi:hypothetical protein HQQ81_12375 [Microbacteriaceae bacterium VKM Ac-2854]|nr:hypothetical protein [Microbacteriaceae bacterium VKM Ac-2854]
MSESEQYPSRRSLTRAAAWTVPAVTMAIAAPSASASGTPMTPNQVAHWGSMPYVPLALDDVLWQTISFTVANFEAPTTSGLLVLTWVDVSNLEIEFDNTLTDFTIVQPGSGNPDYVIPVENGLWTYTNDGTNAYFTTNYVLEPGFSMQLPNQMNIGIRVRAVPNPTASAVTSNLFLRDSITTDGSPVPFPFTFTVTP